ncbi:MAG: UDP-N-acetylmuramoyl-tripeptide--D-alanyl-D-alanine ligase [Gammaproteobacteria bacterium]|nr:UDP-N-acetylmuramoyl-tripeptide--D-alanyl-D-alanine ligase [Gammaproteobacteria bacterium]
MKAALWTADELTEALELAQPAGVDVGGVSIDSRTLEPGDLFIALSGEPDARYFGAGGSGRDGHDFVAAAGRRGAAAALVSRRVDADIPLLQVPDTFTALWQLAASARERFPGPVFAVTGSSGKTTVKSMLAAALPGSHASEGSFNNHIGVPLSLARLPRNVRAGIFEIGMNSPGEIAPLARLVRPRVALVLNVLGVHLEGLGSLDAIRREKLSIATGLDADGVLVVPDTLDLSDIAHRGRRLTFGTGVSADVRLVEEGGRARIVLPDGHALALQLTVEGPHRRLSAAAVVACLVTADLDPAAAVPLLEVMQPPRGRGGSVEVGGVRFIDDSYNANPDSVRFALQALREQPARRRFALLGDMLELGAEEHALHRGLAAACAGVDGVYCVGERMAALHAALPESQRAGYWRDCESLDIEAIAATLEAGDVILVKASNRMFWKAGSVAALLAAMERRQGDHS